MSTMAHECTQPSALLQQYSLDGSYAALMESNVWTRAQYTVVIMLSAAVYCWAVCTAARPGLPRLLACMPVLLAIHGTPLLFDPQLEPFAVITATFLACRLTCGKVLAFIMGRGVLVLPLSLPQFTAVMLAPFMPAQLVASRLSLYNTADQAKLAAEQAKPAQSSTTDTPRSAPESSGHGGTLWQQVTPTQRYSIDSSRHSIDSRRSSRRSIGSRWSMESSSSPKAAATPAAGKHPVHIVVASSGSSSNIVPEAAAPMQGPMTDSSSSSRKGSVRMLQLANMLLNVAVVLAFGVYTCSSKSRMVSASVSISGLWVMWRAMECLMRAASTPARTLLGMTLAPHFRNPFASSSLTDFWARRWNITQGLVLRFFVYEPIVQARLVAETPTPGKVEAAAGRVAVQEGASHAKAEPAVSTDSSQHGSNNNYLNNRKRGQMDTATQQQEQQCCVAEDAAKTPKLDRQKFAGVPVLAAPSKTFAPRWRRQLAAAATFVVSGLEHELFMAYITHSWGWRWFVFFSLQGLLLAVESALKRRCAKLGLQLHPVAASLAVLLVLGVTADEFFWPVLVQPKLVQPLQAALPDQVKELAARLQPLTHRVL